jgi:hypothetical protein
VIFPNKFQQDNFLPAGNEAQFPGPKTPFQPQGPWHRDGRRHLQCDRQGGGRYQARLQEAGIHRELGNYRDFLTRQIVVEGAEKIAEGRTGEREKENVSGVVQGAPASDILSRTAIKLVVK